MERLINSLKFYKKKDHIICDNYLIKYIIIYY